MTMTNLIAAICVATNSAYFSTNSTYDHLTVWKIASALTSADVIAGDLTSVGVSVSAKGITEVRLQSGGSLSSIAETVAVVTNVVKADDERGCSTCDMLERAAKTGNVPAIYHPPHGAEPHKPATERTETTTVVERRTLRFRWSGEWRELTTERVLGEPKVRRWFRTDRWEEKK